MRKRYLLFILMVAGCLLNGCSRTPKALRTEIIKNGGSLTAVIQASKSDTVIIEPGAAEGISGLIEYLERQKIQTVDHLLLLTAEPKSYGGVYEIMKICPVRHLYYPERRDLPAAFLDFLAAIKRSGVEAKPLSRHQYIPLGQAEIIVLNPNPYQMQEPRTLAVKYIFDKNALLFLGALKPEFQNEILETYRGGISTQAAVLEDIPGLSTVFASFIKDSIKILPSESASFASTINGGNIYWMDKQKVLSLEGDGKTLRAVRP